MIRVIPVLMVVLSACMGEISLPRDPATDSPPVDSLLVNQIGCPKLPEVNGAVIHVRPNQAKQLPRIVASAPPGTTILLADGTYTMTGNESARRMIFTVPKVTLRSASGDREKVIIDGEYLTNEIIFIAADDVTIADLTLKRAADHLIHIVGANMTIKDTLLYNLKLVDSGEQFVKVNSDGRDHYVDKGRLECSAIELTAQGRRYVETSSGSCYTGGIDAHSVQGWKVRCNTFKGIYCENGDLAEHAIHFWSASRDTLVERNVIIDCARGIGFGLGPSGEDRVYADDPYPAVEYMGHIDGIIRNNVIHARSGVSRFYDTGIELNQTHGALVYHNTVVSKPVYSSIDYRWPNTKVEIRNNLTSRITVRNGAHGTVDHNLESTPSISVCQCRGSGLPSQSIGKPSH